MEAIETSNSVKSIDGKIFTVQTTAPVIKKDANNPYYGSKYAEYPEIQAKIKPILKDVGLLVMFLPISGNRLTLFVKETQTGEFYKVTSDLNTINVSPQAQGSAITYLKRYMLTAFFDLQIEDDSDDDGNAGSAAKTEPAKTTTPALAATQPPPKGPDTRPYLNPNSEVWFNTKIWLFTVATATMEKVTKKYRITKDNQVLLSKQEDLKPGNKYWPFATVYLATEGNSNEAIVKAFNITESDLQDLQIDATNYTPAEKPQPEK